MKEKILEIIINKINSLSKEQIREIFKNKDLRRYLYIKKGSK